MFGLGLWEIVIIIVAVLIFIKPEDLPGFFRKIGRIYGQIKQYNREMVKKLREIEHDVSKPISQFHGDTQNSFTERNKNKKE